uniref:Hedgehog protein n=1 Tax=Antalis entalis TaxID=211836 RepID=A0A1J0M5M7_9MOLL|nr:hedgehog [Antalis entalis]
MVPQRLQRTSEVLFIIFLLLSGPSLECGPGRGTRKRIKSRKMTPLVFKQHIPNVSEKTVGASGAAEGVIKRSDPKFKELVENNNPDVIFKDEEGTGADRMMSKTCRDKLDTLAIFVMNQWTGVKLRVTEAWDEEHHHAKDSLHYEGRAVDVTTSDRDRSKYGMLARLAVNAGFDWVYYESRAHIHCSVNSIKSAAYKYRGCFSQYGKVFTETSGWTQMSQIDVGSRVLSMTKEGSIEFSEVIAFLDRDNTSTAVFLTLTTVGGGSVTLTPKHLIYTIGSTESDGEERSFTNLRTIFAEEIEEGDQIVLTDTNGDLRLEEVSNITYSTQFGLYAPLTTHGTIIVDGVVVSCYAYFNNIDLTHAVFAPMRTMYSLSQYFPAINSVTNTFKNSLDSPGDGVHWYARLLYRIGSVVLPPDTLHKPHL